MAADKSISFAHVARSVAAHALYCVVCLASLFFVFKVCSSRLDVF